jgi:hypothetical protein
MTFFVTNGEVACGSIFVDPNEVMRETWGHLDTEPGVKHPGSIVFAIGMYSDGAQAIISTDFGKDVGNGPWFYYGINDWLSDQDLDQGVYRWSGWYKLCKNGKHQFVGRSRRIEIGEQ